MKKLIFILFVGIFVGSPLFAQDYKLVWEDNFDGNKLNETIWSVESNEGIWNTGSNQEMEHYRHENVTVGDDGNGNNCLILTAKKESYQNYAFTSGKVETKGKFTFKFGKLVARIKIPDLANGLWPAFWTVGYVDKKWPDCGEIDILEMGHADGIQAGTQNKFHGGALHWEYNDSYAGYGTTEDAPEDLNNDYHLFTLEWTDKTIKTFLDDDTKPYFVMDITGDDLEEFKDYPAFIIFNLAVGGQLPSIYSEDQVTAPFPAKMYIDYVKLYQMDGVGEMDTTTKVTGKFGAYTETGATFQNIDYDFDGSVSASGLTLNETETPFEGDKVLAYTTQPGTEFTLKAGSQNSLNMLNYVNGSISAYIKTDITEPIEFGISDGTNTSYVELSDGVKYNPKRDNTWNRIMIPMSDFTGEVDFSKIKDFVVLNGTSAGNNTLLVDNVIWFETYSESEYLGLYTENPNILDKVTIDNSSVFLYIWENTLSFISSEKPYEGADVLSVKDNGIGWYGFGLFSNAGVDATAFQHGYLILTLKTTCSSNFWIGIGGANDTDGKIIFNNGSDSYGFKRDGKYHTVVVPMDDLNAYSVANYGKELDLTACGNVFMFGGDVGLSAIAIDDVYLSLHETPVENPLIAVLTTVKVTPASSTIKVGSSVKLSAKGLDQLGGAVTIDPVWSASNDGFITESGEFVGITPGTFTVTASADGISGSATVIVEEGLGMKNILAESAVIYPNPATDEINIQSDESITEITIFDLTGKTLLLNNACKLNNTIKMDIGNLKSGIYIIDIQSANGSHVMNKIIKK